MIFLSKIVSIIVSIYIYYCIEIFSRIQIIVFAREKELADQRSVSQELENDNLRYKNANIYKKKY